MSRAALLRIGSGLALLMVLSTDSVACANGLFNGVAVQNRGFGVYVTAAER